MKKCNNEEERSGQGIEVIGADANNLKHIDVLFPVNRVTVVTGVSGSGKSSLLTDTLATEAARRMRVFLGVHQPHLEGGMPNAFIGPMPPAIHIGQRAFRASTRSTIGTSTGLLSTLRRLFITCARPYSDELGRFVPRASPESYAAWLVNHCHGQVTVSAVPTFFIATDGVRQVDRLCGMGITEVTIRSETDSAKVWERGRTVPTMNFRPLKSTVRHIIEAHLGSFDIKPSTDKRKLEEKLRRAFDAGNGKVFVDLPNGTHSALRGPFGPRLDSAVHDVDPDLPTCFFRPSDHLLSFNAPDHLQSGACRTCFGLGRATTLDEKTLIAHPERSMRQGAFSLWTDKNYKYVNVQHETIEGLRGICGFSPDVPWNRLSDEARQLILEGSGKKLITDKDPSTGRKVSSPRVFEGFRHAILSRYARGSKVSESLTPFVCEGVCVDCGGSRWTSQARALRVAGMGIHQLLSMPFIDFSVFTADGGDFAKAIMADASALVRALHRHTMEFVSLGLGHLTGDRAMPDISDGESRRSRLATVLNARHAGLCILLDEPARGLHDEDVQNLTASLADLAAKHTVVVNEHRHALVRAADHVIELGPGAGSAGGEVVFSGPVAQSSWAAEPVLQRDRAELTRKTAVLSLRGATIHNLKGVDCTIPLGRLTCLTGVSGSGKSSFVRGILVPAVMKSLLAPAQLDDFDQRQGAWSSIDGYEHIKGLVALDQNAPPPNRRSIVATLLGTAVSIRAGFGATADARRSGLTASDFGLNAGSGRCQHCLGIGEVEEHGQWVPCPTCGGMRFGQDALSVRADGMNIGDVLNTPIAELWIQLPDFLSRHKPVFTAIVDLGVGHLALGRRLDTLSGGEIQRLRIATKLAEHGAGGLLFVLDEPAAGLHPHDVERLLRALDRILDSGKNTIVVVEHNPSIIRVSDWIIEFGPGSGPHGGRVVAIGPPDKVAKTDTATGRMLSNKPSPSRYRLPYCAAKKRIPRKAACNGSIKQAQRMISWIRHLIGDDVASPDDSEDSNEYDRPIAAVGELFWKGYRAWEIGQLDLEIGKLLLDVEVRSSAMRDIAEDWQKRKDVCLMIHPFLKDIQIWGAQLPKSTVIETSAHLYAMGLAFVNAIGKISQTPLSNWLDARATGIRFAGGGGSIDERCRAIEDALALGGGYAELRDARGMLWRKIGHRRLDLHKGIVGPMAPTPIYFSRHELAGQCRMCKGSGHVMSLAEELIIRTRRASPEDELFLHNEASDILKGVRRSDFLPFFRRLSREGLWDSTTPYCRLDERARALLLYGCWTRPGHGVFLKNKTDDPTDVSAWLRWDGLYNAIMGQLERSTNLKWSKSVDQSRSLLTCPSCEGTGLLPHTKLLHLGNRSLYEWARDGRTREFYKALQQVQGAEPHQIQTHKRILSCLASLAKQPERHLLKAIVDNDCGREISRKVIEAFTDMPMIFI